MQSWNGHTARFNDFERFPLRNAPAIFYQIKTSQWKGLLVTKKQSSIIDHFVNSIDIVNLSQNCTSCDGTLF